jgi:hypothetical protein
MMGDVRRIYRDVEKTLYAATNAMAEEKAMN